MKLYIEKKTQKEYIVITREGTDCTLWRDGLKVVIYHRVNKPKKILVKMRAEFDLQFNPVE